jgi:UDP-3-O-[3-hydroxymyristoyl] N-acetylglucosamine deacetylase
MLFKAKGIGLHTGKVVNMELIPSGPNTGINFIRSDIDENIKIPARVENVGDTSLSNCIDKR